MGSKIFNSNRGLTIDYLETLSAHFKVELELFID